jgi:hypothetical protein
MARTANAKLSATMAGVDRSTPFELRKRDPVFAAAWVRARAWGRARVKAAGQAVHACGRPRRAPPAEALDPRPLKERRSRHGGTEIVRCGEDQMSPETDRIFFANLAAGHGIRRSAAAAGFSTTALYNRRMIDPQFQSQWLAARDQCLARNDMLLIDCVPRTLDPQASEAADDLPRPTIAEAIRITRLYRPPASAREAARRAAEPEPRISAKEVFDALSERLAEIERDGAQAKLDQGWIEDEEGNWIPPGWTKSQAGGGG